MKFVQPITGLDLILQTKPQLEVLVHVGPNGVFGVLQPPLHGPDIDVGDIILIGLDELLETLIEIDGTHGLLHFPDDLAPRLAG